MVVPSERSRLDHDDDGSDGCGATQQDFLPVGPGVGQTVGSNGFGNFATFDPNTPGNPLYLTLFRRYSSTQGRWLSPDPAGLGAADPANPQSWNRYAYVLNNPINFVDPLGLACYTGTDGVIHCISTCGAACAGGGGAGGVGGGAALRPARYSRSASGRKQRAYHQCCSSSTLVREPVRHGSSRERRFERRHRCDRTDP
ncbi:MAG: hypothetical protein DMG21_09650 [Acidobacteria bacterium]|nr:MAG: hypothetical protein DMG21_09650 [Acidobacteriota bacterium]